MYHLGQIILTTLVIIVISSLFVMLGWSLFVVPVFGLPSLTLTQAIGFSILAQAFGRTPPSK